MLSYKIGVVTLISCWLSKVQVICSGTGNWRYVDCVPEKGGKLKALEFVQKDYHIPAERCVSAGDSCNDILMLQGKLNCTCS